MYLLQRKYVKLNHGMKKNCIKLKTIKENKMTSTAQFSDDVIYVVITFWTTSKVEAELCS